LRIALVFAFSGVSALVYQVAWQRLLALQSGVGIHSIATIVAAFLAGLGLGSYVGGRLSRRLSPLICLRLFSALELLIALFGWVSPQLFHGGFGALPPAWFSHPLTTGLLHLSALLPPTFLMGLSFPLLVRATCLGDRVSPAGISALYGLNTLGAAVGALLTPWLLLRYWGIDGAIRIAAALNFLVGLGAFALARALASAPPPPSRPEPACPGQPRPLGLWMALYAFSGWSAIALEILWFRSLDVALKASAFTFGSLLGLFLLGLGLGSSLGGLLARRRIDPFRAFLVCQTASLVYAAAAIALLVRLPPETPVLNDLFLYWQQVHKVQGPFGQWRLFLTLYLVLPLFLFGPVTVSQGLAFAFLQRAVQSDPVQAGHRAGVLQAANIFGCLAGSLGMGWWGLDALGTPGGLRLVMISGLVVAAAALAFQATRRLGGILAVATLAATALIPPAENFWGRLHGQTDRRAWIGEDSSGIAALVPAQNVMGHHYFHVRLSGKIHSTLPFYGNHSRAGALPALVHPNPVHVAVIGLASGESAYAVGLRPEMRHIRVFELSRPQMPMLEEAQQRLQDPFLRRLLKDPRYTFHFEDGRHALATQTNRYDLIITDPMPPRDAYSAHLYSVEFFALCRDRLKPGGMVCTFTPVESVRASFRQIFPEALAIYQNHSRENSVFLLGGMGRMDFQPADWEQRLQHAARDHYLHPTIVEDLRLALSLASWVRGPLDWPVITDLNPRNEFRIDH
jgi:spermidine synthase